MVSPAVAVGGMLASAVIKVVIGQISSTITGEIKLHNNMRKDLENMKVTLESVEAALSDAERRSIKEKSERVWLNRLKHAANDISDMLEDFEDDTDLDLWAATMKKIRMPRKMKKMQKRLQKIKEDRDSYGVLPETRCEERQVPDIRETAGYVEEAEIIWRTDEEQKILGCISGNTTQGTTIFPIWGLGGIGKTTLARSVFNHSHFIEYSRVWVYVSQTFDLKKIGNIIISQLSQRQSQISDLHMIHTSLRELFTGKKILIILDDLWEKHPSQLEKLKAMLKQGEGSKVMVVVTTREESIAKEIGTVAPHELPPFTDEMCWKIIKQKCNFEACPDKERLEPIGKEIAAKCGGVALAAQSLGHMLKCRPYEEWGSVRANHIWGLSTSEDTPNTHEVLASLLLSYNFMPPRLKLCFAYCAIFRKGHDMIKDELIHQWIALGFIEPSDTFSTWQRGQSYVKQLLEMSFLQHSKADTRTLNERKDVTAFTMHDLVHELARSVMADEFNLEGPNCRYACMSRRDCKKPLKSSTASHAKLRALHIVGHIEIQSHHYADSPAKYIHVLDLSPNCWHELPDYIGQLKQLRYLSAPFITMNPRCLSMLSKLNYLNLHNSYFSASPESIGEMKGLMHLDLSNCNSLKELPWSFGKLRQLLYLDLSNCHDLSGIPQALGGLTKLQHLNLSQCKNLRGLPEVICKLTELRCLNLSWCMDHIFDSSSTAQADSFIRCICMLPNMEQLHLSQSGFPLSIPESASRLRKLALDGCCHVTSIPECVAKMDTQSLFGLLPDFYVYSDETESNSNIHLLEHTNPEQLRISTLEDVKFIEEARIINLREKTSIVDLTLEWTEDGERYVEDMELLRELVPPNTLQGFEIYGYCSLGFPDWLMSIICYLPNLARIRLSDLPNCKSLPPLGQLPSLRELILSKMKSLEEWNTTYSSGELMFPKLEEVNICLCPKLRIIPHLPRVASWSVYSSDNVLISWGDSVSHTGASSSSSPVSTRLVVSGSNLPLHQWNLLHHLPALSELIISYCNDLTSSPEIIRTLHSLKSLILDMHGSNQAERVEWFADLTSLQQLTIRLYMELEELPSNMRQLTQLQSLKLFECRSMTSLPEWLGELTSLRKLKILWCRAITALPESIQQLTKLQELKIQGSSAELWRWCAAEENKTKLAHIEQKRIKPEHGMQHIVLTEGDEDEATPAQQKHCGCLRFKAFK